MRLRIVGAIAVALAVTIVLGFHGAARAEVKEVEDVNNPILVPYQETVANPIGSTGFLFSAVAKNHRRRITNVNCGVTMTNGGLIVQAILLNAPGVSATVSYALPVVQQPSAGRFVINASIEMVVNAGEQPDIVMLTSNTNEFGGGLCTVAGSEIRL